MKPTYIIFYIFFAFFLVTPVVQADSVTHWNDRGTGSSLGSNGSPTQGDFRDIERAGSDDGSTQSKLYYESGEVKYIFRYVNGRRHGITKELHKNGTLKAEWIYHRGKLQSGSKGYYRNGDIKYRYRYDNGKRNGITREYYKNGSVKNEWTYRNGKLHGVTRSFFQSGKLKAEWHYRYGKLQ